MRLLIGINILVFAAGVLAATHADSPESKIDKALVGKWIVESAEEDGKPTDAYKGVLFQFGENGKLELTTADDKKIARIDEYTVLELATAAKAGAYHVIPSAGPNRGAKLSGVYAVDKTTLKLCQCSAPPDGKKLSPTEFKTTPLSGHVLLVLKKSE